MLVVLAVILLWDAAHKADIPDTAPHFRVPGHSIIKNPEPVLSWSVPSVSEAIGSGTHRHAQRGDAGTER